MEDMNQAEQLHTNILKELSEIGKNLAVNTSETQNIKTRISEIQNDVKETKNAVQIQNGRITKLEEWSNEARKIIENTTSIANGTFSNYKIDKTRIWAVLGVLLFLGSTIIGLAIMALDSKIEKGIAEALSKYELTK